MIRRSRCRALIAALGAALLALAAAPAGARSVEKQAVAPPGWHRVYRESVAPGLRHERLERGGADPQVVHVARLAHRSRLALRAVLSNEQVAGPGPLLERTSSMCDRWDCLVAINGDFALPGEDSPVGGLIAAGELVRTPTATHHQVSVRRDGTLTTGQLTWRGVVMPSDLQELAIDGVNVARPADSIVLYTSRYGPSTGTNRFGAELVVDVEQPRGPLMVGRTTKLRAVALRDGRAAAPLRPGRLVLSGHGKGAAALRDLWRRVRAGQAGRVLLARLDTDGSVVQSVGGTPVLVRDGRRWARDDGSSFAGRHPRTMIGWTEAGDVLLVTADGRQQGRAGGLSLVEAADLMISLGAVEALNLDGGGSTTFVVDGKVRNLPSDRLVAGSSGGQIVHVPGASDHVRGYVERPVVSALVVVPEKRAMLATRPAASLSALPLPDTAPTTVATSDADPASNPLAALPDLVVELPGEASAPLVPALAAAALLVLSATGVGATHRRQLVTTR